MSHFNRFITLLIVILTLVFASVLAVKYAGSQIRKFEENTRLASHQPMLSSEIYLHAKLHVASETIEERNNQSSQLRQVIDRFTANQKFLKENLASNENLAHLFEKPDTRPETELIRLAKQFIATNGQKPDQLLSYNFEGLAKSLQDESNSIAVEAQRYSDSNQKFVILLVASIAFVALGLTLTGVLPLFKRNNEVEKALNQSQVKTEALANLFESLCHEIDIGVISYHYPSGEILTTNRAFNELSGYTSSELVGKTIWSLSDSSKFRRKAQSKQVGEFVDKFSDREPLMMFTKDEKQVPVSTRTWLTKSSDTQNRIAWSVITNLTEQFNFEARKDKAKKMEALGTLASGVAHDFNNILAIISGSGEMLKQNVNWQEAQLKYINNMLKAADRGADLVRQILTYSRKNPDNLRVINIKEAVTNAVALVSPTLPKKLRLETNIKADGNIVGDETAISQIIFNMISNSAHAHATKISLDLKLSQKCFLLRISDNGEGIESSILERIFDPFYTTKEVGSGTGLGLSVVQGLVNKLNGCINVSSEVGQGTSFEIVLPVSEAKISKEEGTIQKETYDHQMTILIAEDEEDLRDVLRTFLEMNNFIVSCARDGSEALAIYQTNKGNFDLILTDQSMPNMTGLEFLSEVKQANPDQKAVLITGDASDLSRVNDQKALFDTFLIKPVPLEKLLLTIREMTMPENA